MKPTLLEECKRLGIEWRDPPPAPPQLTKWNPVLTLLRERPNVWARIGRYPAYSNASGRANRLTKRHPEFEFCARPIDPLNRQGPGELFARCKQPGSA